MELKYTVLVALLVNVVNLFAQNCGYTLTESSASPSCYGLCDATASVTVTGGTAPYVYAWSNGDNTESVTNLCAGEPSLVVTDALGCDSTFYLTEIEAPDPITIEVSKSDIVCGIKGSIRTDPSGGNPPYKYTFTGYSDSLEFAEFDNLETGSYTLAVGDRKGCTTDTIIEIVEIECIEPQGVEAFTPNGDGINESWQIININLFPNCLVLVYDRWGQKVFESEGYNEAWTGQGMAGIVPAASYYYVILLDKSDKNSKAVKGSVAVVR